MTNVKKSFSSSFVFRISVFFIVSVIHPFEKPAGVHAQTVDTEQEIDGGSTESEAPENTNETSSNAPETPSSEDNTSSDEKTNYGIFKKNEDGLVNLDFVNAEIAEIARSMSELANKNFLFDEKVRGQITMVSPKPVTVDEAFRAFVSALEVKNFTIVKTGDIHKIVPIRNMKSQPINTNANAAYGSYDEFITRLVAIENTSAKDLATSLRGLISQNGDLVAYNPTNTLIITDTVANIRRIAKVIKELDQKGFQESVQIVQLEYAPAVDTAEKIRQIYDMKGANAGVAAKGKASDGIASPGGEDGGQFISKIIPDERTNSLIVVANKEGFRRVEELVKKIDQALIDQAGKGRVHVHYLQYADAIEMAATLSGGSAAPTMGSRTSGSTNNSTTQSSGGNRSQNARSGNMGNASGGGILGSGVLGGDISINADPYTNALIITAEPSDYESLLSVINRLDIRRPQAFVETMILEVNIDKASELGLSANGGGSVGNAKLFGATTFGSNSSLFPSANPQNIQGFTSILQGPTFNLPIGGETLTIPSYGGFFKALQTNGIINVLSTPNILTQDNSEAEIVVGRVVPFITAQGRDINNQPINQVQREDVATTLKIKPQINSSDELTLDIVQESQDIIPGADIASFGPTTSKRSAKTTVLVKDGQTITIGGLISDRITESEGKVPILGDIPILGWLFRNKTKERNKTSLVIFVTPYIIRYPEDLERISLEKNEERLEFLRQNKLEGHPDLKMREIEKKLKLKDQKDKDGENAPLNSPSGSFMSSVLQYTQGGTYVG